MSNQNALPPTAEMQYSPEQPSSFRIGEVIVQAGLIGEDGDVLSEYRGTPIRKRVVMDAYWPNKTTGDNEMVITVMLDEHEENVTMIGSSDYVEQMGSLGKFVSPQTLIDMVLRHKVGGPEALTSENARTRGLAKLYVLDIAEQYVSDKIARGEAVTAAQTTLYEARRMREQEKGKYAMHDDDYFYNPELLADMDVNALFDCINS